MEGIERRRSAAIQERVEAQFAQFFFRDAVADRTAQMHADLGRAVERNDLRQRDQTAVAQRQARARPYRALGAFSGVVLKRPAERVGVLECAFDVIGPQHFFARGESCFEGFAANGFASGQESS